MFLSMLHCKIILLFLVPVTLQSYNRRPKANEERYTKPFEFPDYTNKEFASQVKIPNEEFCSKMALRDHQFYMVMPWWYHHCEALKERTRRANKRPDRAKLMKPFNAILDRIQRYKEKQKIWKELNEEFRSLRRI